MEDATQILECNDHKINFIANVEILMRILKANKKQREYTTNFFNFIYFSFTVLGVSVLTLSFADIYTI